MGKSIIVAIFILLFVINSNSQVTQEWVQGYNGSGIGYDNAIKVLVDALGNVYVTGESNITGIDFDYCTIKYNSSGIVQWLQRYIGNASGWDQPASMVLDRSGNVYVTGRSQGTGTGMDYVTIKYSSSGIIQWIQRYDYNGGEDEAADITIDTLNNIYVTGSSRSTLNDEIDFATIKYNSSGVRQWVQRYTGLANENDYAEKIAVDKSGNVYVTGSSFESGILSDITTIKYNSGGIAQWVRQYDGPSGSNDRPSCILVDNSGSVYVAGYSTGIGTQGDYTTIKYNSSGLQLWEQRDNGPANDFDYITDMVLDNSGNVYVTGTSASDYYTIKYSSSGIQQWSKRYATEGGDHPDDIAIDKFGNIYVTGSDNANLRTDFATIKYNSDGTQLWIQKYLGLGTRNDANSITVDTNGYVYVTGSSSNNNNTDFATIKYSQSIGIQTLSNEIPNRFFLSQNFPNPFNPTTNIKFDVLKSGIVSIRVFDILGKEIQELVKEFKHAGSYQITFDGSQLGSGVYFYEMQTSDFIETKRMLLVK